VLDEFMSEQVLKDAETIQTIIRLRGNSALPTEMKPIAEHVDRLHNLLRVE